jgi:hypothetical protein
MEITATLKVVGQVAGIGGIALGVLMLIFREVIRKNIFPNLAQIQAYRIIRLVVVLTFLIAASGVAAWVYVQRVGTQHIEDTVFPGRSPEPAMLKHLQSVDEGYFADAWASMAEEAHKRMSYEFVSKAYESQRAPLGAVITRKLYGISPFKQLPDQTRGAFNTATFVTQFGNGGKYIEAVTVIAESGEWKVLFHQIAPCSPPTCTAS